MPHGLAAVAVGLNPQPDHVLAKRLPRRQQEARVLHQPVAQRHAALLVPVEPHAVRPLPIEPLVGRVVREVWVGVGDGGFELGGDGGHLVRGEQPAKEEDASLVPLCELLGAEGHHPPHPEHPPANLVGKT